MANKITLGSTASKKIISGVNQLADLVKTTLGPAGNTVLIDNGYGSVHITKDGVTVATSVDLEDPLENMAAQLVKEIALKSNKEAGDGTTTATVLAQALVNGSFNLILEGKVSNINVFRKQMVDAMEEVVAILEKISMTIGNDEAGDNYLRKIASISSNGDKEIADLIMEALDIVRDSGAIRIDIGKEYKSKVESRSGISFANGMVSGYMATDKEKMEWRYPEDTYIFLTDFTISHLEQIEPIMEYCHENTAPLLIICDDIDESALRYFMMNVMNGSIRACIVKAPGFGNQKAQYIEDIAAATGAKAILKDRMAKLQDIINVGPEEILGRASTVIVRKNEFSIIDGLGDKDVIELHKKSIVSQIEAEEDPYLKGKCQERLAKMSTGVALIYVGAESDVAAREMKDRVEDAVNSVKAAQEGGFVPGGGMALERIVYHLAYENTKKGKNSEMNQGKQVLLESILEPIKTILHNAGYQWEYKAASLSNYIGKDLFTGRNIDYIEKGIIDPTKVTITALKNAVSICSTLITVSGTIHIVPEAQKSLL